MAISLTLKISLQPGHIIASTSHPQVEAMQELISGIPKMVGFSLLFPQYPSTVYPGRLMILALLPQTTTLFKYGKYKKKKLYLNK
jgi:hypothetical protein